MRVFSYPCNHLVLKLFVDQWTNIQEVVWTRLPHKAPIIVRALNFVREFDMVLDLPESYRAYWIPPWIAISGIVSLDFLNCKKSEVSDPCAQQLFMDLVNTRYDDCLQILPDGRVGAAM